MEEFDIKLYLIEKGFVQSMSSTKVYYHANPDIKIKLLYTKENDTFQKVAISSPDRMFPKIEEFIRLNRDGAEDVIGRFLSETMDNEFFNEFFVRGKLIQVETKVIGEIEAKNVLVLVTDRKGKESFFPIEFRGIASQYVDNIPLQSIVLIKFKISTPHLRDRYVAKLTGLAIKYED
jgi:hypothetical protein